MKRTPLFWFTLAAVAAVFLLVKCCGAQEWKGAIVQIRAGHNGGSGVHVGEGLILTANHVTEERDAVITWPSGHVTNAQYLSRSKYADLSAVRTTPPAEAVSLPISDSFPAQGDQVLIAGYGPGRLSVRVVQANGYRGNVLDTTPGVISGDSGGAFVANDKLVGIITSHFGESYAPENSMGPAAPELQRFTSAVTQLQYRNCPPGGCQPFGGIFQGPRYRQSPAPEYQPPQGTPYVPPTTTPPRVTPPTPETVIDPPAVTLDYDKLAAALVERIADDPRFRGPVGPAGPPGVGMQGSPGVSPTIDYDTLAAEVDKRLPPLTISVVDESGSVLYSESRRLGETLKIQFAPKGS